MLAPPVVDIDHIGRQEGQLVSVDCDVTPHNGRPHGRVRCRFAGEVSGIKLGDGGVEVVGVESDNRRDPVVGVELGDTRTSVRKASARGSRPEERAR